MTFTAKLRKIGNSQGIYIKKEYLGNYKIGDVITILLEDDVITEKKKEVITQPEKKFNTEWCKTHDVMKGSCGCQH